MKRQRHADSIVAALEDAFAPGRFIADQACFQFIRDLETTIQPIVSLLDTDPPRALSLYEMVLAGCYLKAEELDDSSGSFGTFIKEVVIHWVHARQKAVADPVETASTLLNWIGVDPYGFCSGLEKELCSALDASGLIAFELLVRGRYEVNPNDRQWSSLLRQIYFQQKRTDAYASLAYNAGYPSEDCLALAQMHAETDLALALQWVDRGLVHTGGKSYSAARYDLPRLRRELLSKLGRGEEALASAWDEFSRHLSKHTLDELLRYVPPSERDPWRERALENAKGSLRSMMQLFAETSENARLANLTEATPDKALEELSHTVTEPAATMLEQTHPFLAARLWRAQALRIVNAGKSKYYEAAIDNLERAHDCFQQAGRDAEWEKTALEISRAHSRKQSFIREFASIVSGERIIRLSFLEAAMVKWHNRSIR